MVAPSVGAKGLDTDVARISTIFTQEECDKYSALGEFLSIILSTKWQDFARPAGSVGEPPKVSRIQIRIIHDQCDSRSIGR